MQMMSAVHEGIQTFGVPVLAVNKYLDKIPKHGRWVIWLVFGMLCLMTHAFLEGDKQEVRALIGDTPATPGGK